MRLLSMAAAQQGANIIDADVKVYFDSLTTPLSANTKKVINTNITGLKKALSITSLSDAFDQILILGNETQEAGLNNVAQRLYDATPVDSPTFTQYIGFNGDGLTKYINSNYTPSLHTDNFTLNNASLGMFKNEDQMGVYYDIGARAGASLRHTWFSLKHNLSYIRAHISDDVLATDVNALIEGTNPNTIALYTVSRLASTGFTFYRNETVISELNYASSALTDYPLFVCGMNNAGSLFTAAPSTKQLSLSFIGRGFSAAEMVHVSYWFNKLIAEMQVL